MRHYAGWSEDNEYYLTMKEIHADFFECLLEHVGKIEPEYGFGELILCIHCAHLRICLLVCGIFLRESVFQGFR